MNCWEQVKALKGAELKTLDRARSFEILDVEENTIVLKVISTGEPRTLRRQEIEGAFQELVLRGQISRTEIGERHSQRSTAYVAAILAQLDGVTYRDKPIRLFYKRGQ